MDHYQINVQPVPFQDSYLSQNAPVAKDTLKIRPNANVSLAFYYLVCLYYCKDCINDQYCTLCPYSR